MDRALLREVAERLMRHPFQAWFYGDSIGFEGLLAASALLGDPRYADFAHGFLRGWAARDEPRRPDDNTAPGHVLFRLPELRLPSWAASVRVGGAVTSESLVGALYDGLRLSMLFVCFGAANTLASPYRLLRCLPASLYEAGVAVTVALSFACIRTWGIVGAASLAFFALLGFEDMVYLSEEVHDSPRTMPRAMMASVCRLIPPTL